MRVITADERRRDVRHPVRLRLDVPLATWGQLERLYTDDLSRGGLGFSARWQPPVGTEVRVVLHLPGERQIALDAKVRHAEKLSDGLVHVGIQFVDGSAASAAILDAYLTTLAGA